MSQTLNFEIDGLAVYLPQTRADYRHLSDEDFLYRSFIQLCLNGEPSLCAMRVEEEGSTAEPMDVYHGLVHRYYIPSSSRLGDVRTAMRRIAPMCAELLHSFSTKREGRHLWGRCDYSLRVRIQNALNEALGVAS